MSPGATQVNRFFGGFPRPRGDEPALFEKSLNEYAFSPPARG